LILGTAGAVLALGLAWSAAHAEGTALVPGRHFTVDFACRTPEAAAEFGAMVDRKVPADDMKAYARAIILSGDCLVLPSPMMTPNDGTLVKIVSSSGETDVWEVKVETYTLYVPTDRAPGA
jgi:hypothetical protein